MSVIKSQSSSIMNGEGDVRTSGHCFRVYGEPPTPRITRARLYFRQGEMSPNKGQVIVLHGGKPQSRILCKHSNL